MKVVFSNDRVVDTLKKYSNHTITSIYQATNFIQIELEFNSPSQKSKTTTTVNIYCDNYFELEKAKDEHK